MSWRRRTCRSTAPKMATWPSALAGDWKDYELWFAWRPEGDCLQLCLSMDLTVTKEQREAGPRADRR